jgi:hypothetical protein
MATFLDRWLGFVPTPVDYFDDDGSVHESALNRAAAAGVVRGCNPPEYDLDYPDQPVTRGQMAAMLHRAAELT